MWFASSRPCRVRIPTPIPLRRKAFCVVGGATLALVLGFRGVARVAWAAETATSPTTTKTQLVVKLATEEALSVRSGFQENPPTIIIEFPGRRVLGSLPERSVFQGGVIEEIRTAYASATGTDGARWIRALSIQLQAPYPHQVHVESGRIIVEIEHPANVTSKAMEVGLGGGVVVASASPQAFSERFRAMQQALMNAGPQSWVWNARSAQPSSILSPEHRPSTDAASSSEHALHPARRSPSTASPQPSSGTRRVGLAGVLAIGSLGLAGLWLGRRRRRRLFGPRPAGVERLTQGAAGMRLIDALVWRAFERQGHQLIQTVELDEPHGRLRIVAKDGRKIALGCISDGVFFEKTSVEQFVQSMRTAHVEQGVLVAPGSFTIPAQRCAKEHGVTLIGRDQLTELLSEGAMSEYYAKQLQQLQAQLEESKETLRHYADQLDVIRRQRNEASWFLGEERAKSGKLQAQLDELNQQVRHWHAQAEQWQQTAGITQKEWEESQWYLGEAKESVRHLEGQLRALQESHRQLEEGQREVTAKLQESERQRAESTRSLEESLAAQAALDQQIQGFTQQLAEVQGKLHEALRSLEDTRQRLEVERARWQSMEAELRAIRRYGERRRALRSYLSDALIELQDNAGSTLFQGIPRDISRTGFRVDSPQPLELPETLRVRLHLPSARQPFESTGRRVWQRRDARTHRFQGGCQFSTPPPKIRQAITQALRGLESAGNQKKSSSRSRT